MVRGNIYSFTPHPADYSCCPRLLTFFFLFQTVFNSKHFFSFFSLVLYSDLSAERSCQTLSAAANLSIDFLFPLDKVNIHPCYLFLFGFKFRPESDCDSNTSPHTTNRCLPLYLTGHSHTFAYALAFIKPECLGAAAQHHSCISRSCSGQTSREVSSPHISCLVNTCDLGRLALNNSRGVYK